MDNSSRCCNITDDMNMCGCNSCNNLQTNNCCNIWIWIILIAIVLLMCCNN